MDCAVCGSPKANISMGSTPLCRDHAEDIRVEMDKLRAEDKPVNVPGIARRMYRELHPGGSDHLVRDVPPELWEKAKHKAIDEKMTLNGLVVKALREYVNKDAGASQT